MASSAYSYSPTIDPFHHSSHLGRTKPIFSSLLSDHHQHSSDHIVEAPDHHPPLIKPKPSPQLQRWSRARSLRSGRRLLLLESRSAASTADAPAKPKDVIMTSPSDDDAADDVCLAERQGGKSIYLVSDGTGWTAEHSVNAALGQFEHCLADRGCAVSTHLFSGVEDADRLADVIKQAALEGALLLYTLADPAMAEAAKQACKVWAVPAADILGPITDAIAAHLGVSPSGIPRGAAGRRAPLSKEYFRRIEAIEFTIKQDDGAKPQNLNMADIVLVGVSRTGKTPLSIYLAQKGYKVANVPIVMGVAMPTSLFVIEQDKIFGLTINPVVLQAIRRARAKSLGFDTHMKSNYSDMDHVREELVFAGKIFARNPVWPVIGKWLL